LRRKHRVAVPAALALLNPDQHAAAVDIVDLEMRDFRHAKSGTIGHAECCLILDARGRLEQPCGLLDAQHLAHPMRAACRDQAARQFPTLQRDRVEETQRRDRTIDRRCTCPALVLVNLKAAQIIDRRCIRWAAQKGSQAPNMLDVIMLCMRAEPPHHHVVLHPLTKRVDGCLRDSRLHGKFLLVEGTPWSNGDSAPPKAPIYHPASPYATLPRSGFVHVREQRR
jgi:hypothetical protein